MKLTNDFDNNEKTYSFIHHSKSFMLGLELQRQARLGPATEALEIAKAELRAMGGTPRAEDSVKETSTQRVKKARDELEKSDSEFKTDGDRITTLLIANKCSPPDHVTTWLTHDSELFGLRK